MQQMRLDADIEEYMLEMADELFQGVEQESTTSSTDILSQLAQKEKDLILAAQLGKALLEKNEDLGRQNEKIAEDFSHKLEILEQEKYILRRKLENVSGEYEMRVAELQNDISNLQEELHQQQSQVQQAGRDKHQIISDLTEQNVRLTARLKEASKLEESLNSQLKSLRDQFNTKRSTLTENTSTIELMKEEIVLLTDKKIELERRLDTMMSERNNLTSSLDEYNDRIQMLERHSREQDYQLQSSCREVDELRSTNTALIDRFEAMSRQSMSPIGVRNTSLHSEMESSDSSGVSSALSSHRGWNEEGIDEIDEDIEVDDPNNDYKELTGETLEIYNKLKNLVDQIRHRRCSSVVFINSQQTKYVPNIKISPHMGMLISVTKQLKGLVEDLLNHDINSDPDSLTALQAMEAEAHRAREQSESLQRSLKTMEEQLHRQTEQVNQLHGELGVSQAQVAAAKEERDTLRDDINNTHLPKDELIKKAWETRDQAMQRKNNAEIELARTRIDVMQINSQLMEVVQQKIELSQQLEQWQMDMQTLLEEQMKRKLDKQLKADVSPTSNKTTATRLLNLLRR